MGKLTTVEHALTGQVVPVGGSKPYWIAVTAVLPDSTVRGRRWSDAKQAWSLKATMYDLATLGQQTPATPKPPFPLD